MTEISKKQRVQQKREARVEELVTIFRRSYEMARAWGSHPQKAYRNAFKEVNTFIDTELKRVPQERSFMISCAMEFKEKLPDIVKQEEGKDVS